MKKQLTTILIAFISFGAISQEIIENPKHSRSFPLKGFSVSKVVLSENETILHMCFKSKRKKSAFLPKDLFIETENTSKKYFLKRYKNIALGEKVITSKNGEVNFQLVFPAIPKDANSLELKFQEEAIGKWKGQPRRDRLIIYKIQIQPDKKLDKGDTGFVSLSLEKAFKKAKQENKNVLLYFTAHWCGPCNWMQENIFPDPEVNAFIKQNYVAIQLNRDTNLGANLIQKYGGNGIPYFVSLTPNNEVLKTQIGSGKRDAFLEFLKINDTIKPKVLQKVEQKPTVYRSGFGVRMGMVNNSFGNNASDSRTGFAADVFVHLEHPNDSYIFRYGLGFHSKGVDGLSVNYLKLPFEFGVKIFNGSIINVPGGIRANVSPYYALRLNKNNLGLQNNDYGTRFGLSHFIGGAGSGNTMELELYYEHGFQDILKSINGKQSNRAFRVSLLLSF
jgi:thiol-disulfide isomerase/thioredoxin